MSAWTGASASLDSQYAYLGTVYALSGDVDADGPLARIGAGGGQYETSGNNSHNVDHFDVDAMLGYRKAIGPAIVALYAGGAYEEHDNSDTHTDIRGSKLGLLELIDPLDGSCFDDRAIAAAHYATERLGDLLQDAEKGIGKVVCIDSEWETIAAESSENPAAQVTGTNAAYIIYTSGSTGRPTSVFWATRA